MLLKLQIFVGLVLLLLEDELAMALTSFKVVIDKCPPGFEKISNGCYQFSNYTSTSLTRNQAKEKCDALANTTTPEFDRALFHLLALEALGETISVFYYIKGGAYNHSFWLDTVRTFGWDWRYEWSGHKFVSPGFLSDLELKTNSEEQNHMYMARNATNKYEYRAANEGGDASINNEIMGYICEASLPCHHNDTNYLCMNNGSCYINTGKVMCVCPPGYTGYLCESLVDTCDSSPCLNGGNCSSSVNSYKCDCSGLFFTGTDCEDEIPNPDEEYRLIAWTVIVGVLGGLILFLCIMDFPLTYLVGKLVDKKNNAVTKHVERKEARYLKKQFKEEKIRMAEAAVKRSEAKREAKSEIRAEQFLSSEEQMLRRFKQALEKSNETHAPRKSQHANSKPHKKSMKSMEPAYAPSPVAKSHAEAIPEYVEYEE